jgi:hypothetical protein
MGGGTGKARKVPRIFTRKVAMKSHFGPGIVEGLGAAGPGLTAIL